MTTKHKQVLNLIATAFLASGLAGCGKETATVDAVAPAPTAAEDTSKETAITVNQLADRYYAETLSRTPEVAYFSGVELERHDGMADNSPAAREAGESSEDAMLSQLQAIDADSLVGKPAWITQAYLLQALKSSVGTRVCRSELWNVNQMGGWHSGYGTIARLQPVGTAELREQSLARWAKLAGFVDQEIANLETGLASGYSAPKAVTRRVIDQFDGLLALEIEKSPFYSPATRDEDASFAIATRAQPSRRLGQSKPVSSIYRRLAPPHPFASESDSAASPHRSQTTTG